MQIGFFPFQILSPSTEEDEVEVLVKLLESSSANLLDQQTLVISAEEKEAIFNFAPINSNSENLTIEVRSNFVSCSACAHPSVVARALICQL